MLNDEQLKSIAEQVTNSVSEKVLQGIEEKAAKYYVDRKKHWKHHNFLDIFIRVLKWIAITTGGAVVLGILGAIGYFIKQGINTVFHTQIPLKPPNIGK